MPPLDRRPWPFLEEIFMAADDLAEYGVNYNTNTKDAHAFDQWIAFCEMFETEPLRTARMARDDPEREQHLLSLFALWVYPRLKPRSRDCSRVSSVRAACPMVWHSRRRRGP